MSEILSVFSSPLFLFCFFVGVVLFLLLFFSLGRKRQIRGKVLEKRVSQKGKLVLVVFQSQEGKRRTFWVDRETSRYIFPGEVGVLTFRRLGGNTYISGLSGLRFPVKGGGRQYFLPLTLFLLFFGLSLGYLYAYPKILAKLKARWPRKVSRPREKSSSLSITWIPSFAPLSLSSSSSFSFFLSLLEKLASPLHTEKAFWEIFRHRSKWEKRVIKALEKKDPFLVSQCIRILGHWKDKNYIPLLKPFLKHPNPYIVFWTHWALCQIQGEKFYISWPLSQEERKRLLQFWEVD